MATPIYRVKHFQSNLRDLAKYAIKSKSKGISVNGSYGFPKTVMFKCNLYKLYSAENYIYNTMQTFLSKSQKNTFIIDRYSSYSYTGIKSQYNFFYTIVIITARSNRLKNTQSHPPQILEYHLQQYFASQCPLKANTICITSNLASIAIYPGPSLNVCSAPIVDIF